MIYRRGSDLIIVGIYVDNLLIGANSNDSMQWTKTLLRNESNMKDLGAARTIIGWQISRNLKAGTLLVGQWNYVRDLLESEGLTNCNPCSLPMKAGSFLDTDHDGDNEETELKAYQSLIGKLMYLACGTRPDISFIVGQLGRHNSDPRVGHIRIAKQVVRYLKGSASLSLCYGRETRVVGHDAYKYGLVGCADSNYAGDPEDRKSVMGYCFFFNGALATWSSKKQITVSTSTTEAEYIALGHGAREAVWLRRLVNELMPQDPITKITLLSDNESSIPLIMNAKSQNCTKYIDIIQHFVRGVVEDGEVEVNWVLGPAMLADATTKGLPAQQFKRHRDFWGLVETTPSDWGMTET